MKSAEPQPLRRRTEQRPDPLAHFPRRLVGEGDGEHLIWKSAVGQQDMGKTRGQHPRFAGARAREHQQRPVDGFHRQALLGIQAGEIIAHDAEQEVRIDTIQL